MKKFIACCLFAFLFCISCDHQNKKKDVIVVSISPYHNLLKSIVEDTCAIHLLIKPSNSPHDFEPTAKEIQLLYSAKIWFILGENFEKKLAQVLQKNRKTSSVVDLTEGIDLIYNADSKDEMRKDVHLWLSPQKMQKQLKIMTEVLCQKFPQHQQLYVKNLQKLSERLVQLDKNIRNKLKKHKNAMILLSHPSLSYFCQDYDLQQLTTEENGHTPNGKYLQKLLEKTKNQQIKTALIQPQHNNLVVQHFAKYRKIPVRYIDPFSPSYFENMEKIAEIIEQTQQIGSCYE